MQKTLVFTLVAVMLCACGGNKKQQEMNRQRRCLCWTAHLLYDLFRIENGKIAEHWDVMETIAPESEWKHQNGKYNFPK